MEQTDCQGAKYWLYSVFEYYSNNILFVFVFGHNSESEYYSYSYSAKYLCTNIIRIRICSFWKNEYYSYSYSVQNLIPNIIRIRIRSKKQYSLTSVTDLLFRFPLNWSLCWWERERAHNKYFVHTRTKEVGGHFYLLDFCEKQFHIFLKPFINVCPSKM